MRRTFSDLCPEDLVGPLELKLTKASPKAEALRVFSSQTSPISGSSIPVINHLPCKCFYPKLPLAAVLLPVRGDPLDVSHSILKVVACPVNLSSLTKVRRVVGFQFVLLFPCGEDGSDDFQVLYMWGWKPEVQVSVKDYQIRF